MRRPPPSGNPLRLASSNAPTPPQGPPQPFPPGTDIATAFLAATAERHGGVTLSREDVIAYSHRLVVIEPAVLDPSALTLRVVDNTPAAVARHWATRAVASVELGDHRGASEALREFAVASLTLDADTAETLRGIVAPILGPRAPRPRGGVAGAADVPTQPTPADAQGEGDAPTSGLAAPFRPEGG